MPLVELPDGREVEFPDGTTPAAMTAVLRRDFTDQFPLDEAAYADYQRRQPSGAPNLPFSPEAGTELITEIGRDPVAAVKAIPGIAFGAAAAPGKLAYNAAADVVAAIDPEHGREYGGNLAAMQRGEDRTPAQEFIGGVARTNPKLAVTANLAKALPELASMMAVNPSGAAGRLLAAGFSADMIANAKPLFDEYAAEINKPLDEQDAGKRAELEAGIIQTFTFAPLAMGHAFGRDASPAEVAGRMLAKEVSRADFKPVPVPESPAALKAQVEATIDPYNPKAVTLVTPGEPRPEAKGLVSVDTAMGEALVNAEKVDPKLAKTELDAGRGGQLLGMSTAEKPPLNPNPNLNPDLVLETKTPEGVPVQQEVVTPETLPAAIEAGQAVAPEGTQQLKPAEQILAERISSSPEASPPAAAKAMAGGPSKNVPPARGPSKAAPEPTTPPAEQSLKRETTRPGDAIEETKAEQPAQPGGAPAIEPPAQPAGKRIARGISGSARFNRETELGGPDILEFIREFGGMVSKTEARRSRGAEWWHRNQSLYDDATPLAQPHHNIIYTKGRNYPDQIAQAAYEARVLPEPSVPALWAAIRRSSNRRANVFAQAREQASEIQRLEKEHTDWLKATAAGEQRINADDLKVGDLMDVEGEQVRVKEIDPDTGDVILDDGKKFGTQRLPGGQTIHVEKFETTDTPVEFEPTEPTAIPKLRTGEKGTGDLLQGEDAPFNLAGEKGIDVERIAREKAQAEATAKANAEFQAKHQQPLFGGSGLAASKTPGVTDFPVLLGGLDAIRPLETPELLRLTREFAGSEVAVRKLRGYLRGYMKGKEITLSKDIFADPKQVAMTLAHEIGHVNDFMPEGTLKRGNVIGRLIGSVQQFLKGSFGGLSNGELRTELKALSAFWRPWDEAKASKSEKAYRNSAKELYADAISVLLNSPGLLEQRAPKFYKAFFEHLDAKPKFKEEFFALQDLLSRGPEAVLGERLRQSREGFEKGEAILHEKIAFRQAARNSFKDFLTKVRIQSSDIASFVRRKLGSKDPAQPSEFDRLYEEWKFDDNRNAADVAKIYHEMIQPVVKAGLDEHAFGQVLELQRIAGGLDAYRDMQTMRKTLGPDKMAVLAKASDTLAELERKGVAEEQAIEQVIIPLERAGLEFDLIDKFRQLREAQGTRAELANPQGRSPIMAEAELNQLLESVTPEQRAALLDAANKFRQLLYVRTIEARDAGIFNKLTHENVITPNKDTYAAFRPLDKIEPYVTPMVRRARGTLNDIENPFITTLLKLQSLNNLIETQKVKNTVRDQMGKLFPGEFTPAATRWTGRRLEAVPPKPGLGRVKILENGKLVEYDADPYVAKMFEQLTPTDSFWLNKVLEVPFRTGIYPLIIKYNPGFLFAFNPRRDMARTIRNLYAVEGVPRRELLPNYASPEVLRAVGDYLEGRPNPLAEAMIRNKAITPSWQGFAHLERDDVMADLLRRYKLAGEPERNAAKRALMWLPNKINEAGSFLEALPKFASYKTLIERGVEPERAAYLVRNYAGTPNFKVKGQSANVINAYLPFMNIFLQGWKADLKLATNPRTAGGWWLQWMLQHGWQATIAGLAVAGVFGDDIKKLYEGISEYDRTNYGVLPLGRQMGAGEFGQKTVYVRTPRDETSRFFSALTYKLTRALADKAMGNAPHPQGLPVEVFAQGAGNLPGLNPILNVGRAWTEYAAGRNPIDPFRNQPVMSERNFKAGGLPAAGDMAKWTLNQSGMLNLVQWNPQAETTTELAISGTPVINRLLKVSDQGYREQQRDSESLDASAKAKLRVQYGGAAEGLVAKHAWLQSLGPQKRTPAQEQKYQELHAWKVNFYDRADEAAWNIRDDHKTQAELIRLVNQEAERFKRQHQTP